MDARKVFENLGFEEDWNEMTDRQPGYFCNFGNLLLKATQVTNQYFKPVFLVTGVWRSSTTLAMIENYLPLRFASFEQGVAWIAYVIGDDFVPTIPKAWLDMGRQYRDQLPWEINRREYNARPKCVVERDWFRVASRKMRESALYAGENDFAWFAFDGAALSITHPSGFLVMPATGSAWPARYAVQAKTLDFLPQRLLNPVYLSVWEHQLTINCRCWPIIEADPVTKAEPRTFGANMQES